MNTTAAIAKVTATAAAFWTAEDAVNAAQGAEAKMAARQIARKAEKAMYRAIDKATAAGVEITVITAAAAR